MSKHDVLIERFLANYRESDGGYADITGGDVALLREIIQELIEAKCARDCSGHLPLQVKVINRKTHESIPYVAVPHRLAKHKAALMQLLMHNVGYATDRLGEEIRENSA